ncbi:unnamed protein product [Lactuca saligna]|uniref:RlpA-like double-psi beta-barrel domain-containing protein n=1 Tax=Lactuca saligna TaxID=75948 RepID=A0AA36E128_LACSI|nr:unnamed protein product [Lactuca saligna]
MTQPTIIVLILFSLLITNAKSRGKNVTPEQHVSKRLLLGLANITQAPMTISSFEKGGDGGAPSACDGKYHSNSEYIVALSTKWYNHGQRCFDYIDIYYHDKSAKAMVIDECGSKDCPDNIVVASKAIWVFLQVPHSEWGETVITWSVPI